MNIFIKWFAVVWFNTILGFLLGYNGRGEEHLSGMILGVMTWYFIYVFIDYLLKESGREKESRRLFLSALIRIPLQLAIVPDMSAGMAAIFTLQVLGLDNEIEIVNAYLMTVFTGLYLSLLCGVIFVLIGFIGNWLDSRKDAVAQT